MLFEENRRKGRPEMRGAQQSCTFGPNAGRRDIGLLLLALLFVATPCSPLFAQGIATGAIRGHVSSPDSSSMDGTQVRVTNTTNGYTVQTRVRFGRFLVQGLDVGGPYSVTLTRIGYVPLLSDGIILRLGQHLDLRFIMQPQAAVLTSVAVRSAAHLHDNTHGGTATTIPGALIHRLPTPDRNIFDFARLAPQISTKLGSQRTGISAAGANSRFNNFLVDGSEERFVNGNVSSAHAVGRSIPVAAVREYEVLVAPYDVRYGDFSGALINTVTESGTNEWHGSAFAGLRNDRLARRGDGVSPYDRLQYGFALGGPILRDRLHFFIAPEFQRLSSPAPGPFQGQAPGATPTVPVSPEDIARLQTIMRAYGLEPGSPGAVQVSSPLRNVFARVDAAIPRWHSRISLATTYAAAEDENFSRADTFALSSYRFASVNGMRMASLRVHTDLPGTTGGHNQLTISQHSDWGDFTPDYHQPLIRVVMPATAGGNAVINAGGAGRAHGRFASGSSLRIRDDLSVPLGAAHLMRFGAQVERFKSSRSGEIGGYGTWTFAGLDAFEQGIAFRYDLRRNLEGNTTTLTGDQYAAWVGGEWRVAGNAILSTGLRADLLNITAHAPYNHVVDSIFGRRTDAMPRGRVHFSPRVGFSWDVFGTGRHQLRGGAGMFTGRPPVAWFVPAVSGYGVGIGVLKCDLQPGGAGPPPIFVPDYRAAPTSCASGSQFTPSARVVDLLDRDLKLAQVLRASLAYDRQLPWGMRSTTEVLVSSHISDFMFTNLNLVGPQGSDRFGRVLYGSIDANGVSPLTRSAFAEVIDLTNTSRNYSYQLSTRLEKSGEALSAVASYTFTRARDVQSLSRVNQPGIALWGDARALSGYHEDPPRGTSINDIPHRIVAAVAYTVPWKRVPTTFSLYYVGESGSPFTYLSSGDLNADGSSINDPVYVPLAASDTSQIQFSGLSSAPGADNSAAAQGERIAGQQDALQRFVSASRCLSAQRGRILRRNSCREPWSNTIVASVRQVLPFGAKRADLSLDAFNVLNLLSNDWGLHRASSPLLLARVGQTAGSAQASQPVFRFDSNRTQWQTLMVESAFQLQVTLRYRF